MQTYIFLTFILLTLVKALIENCFTCANWNDCNDNAGFIPANKFGTVKPYLNQSGKTKIVFFFLLDFINFNSEKRCNLRHLFAPYLRL